MKLFIVVIISILTSFSAYAQTNIDEFTDNNSSSNIENKEQNLESENLKNNELNDNNNQIENNSSDRFRYSTTLGLVGFGLYGDGHTNNKNQNPDIERGGGMKLRVKSNFYKYLGLHVDLTYSYMDSYLNGNIYEDVNQIMLSHMIVGQYGVSNGESGFVPWAGIGFSVGTNIYNLTGKGTKSLFGEFAYSVDVGAGVRYQFAYGLYLGIDFSYSIGEIYSSNWYNIKTGLEIGYRF